MKYLCFKKNIVDRTRMYTRYGLGMVTFLTKHLTNSKIKLKPPSVQKGGRKKSRDKCSWHLPLLPLTFMTERTVQLRELTEAAFVQRKDNTNTAKKFGYATFYNSAPHWASLSCTHVMLLVTERSQRNSYFPGHVHWGCYVQVVSPPRTPKNMTASRQKSR